MSKPKKKKKEAPAGVPDAICVAGHPRSAQAVRRAKGWGGVVGVALCTALALGAHLTMFDALLRGLAGGVVAYLVVWALALVVARQLVVAEVRAHYTEVAQAAAAAAAAASAAPDS
jgi:predicted lipid-binding transport protein (Tim44 family)